MQQKLYRHKMAIIGLLLGVSSLTSLLPPFTSNTSATTIYDGAYVTTDDLIIDTDYYSFNCGSTNITATWKDKLLNDASWSSSAYGIADRDAAQSSFETALNQGAWAVTERTWIESGETHRQRDMVEVTWVEDTSDAHIEFADAGTFYGTQIAGDSIWKVVIATEKAWTPTGSGTCDPKVITAYEDNSSQWISVPHPDDGGSMYRRENFLAANWTLTTPQDYENYQGAQIRGDEDVDGDELSIGRELTQGTSDAVNHEDTDGDGIDDLKESQWYSNRSDTYCKSDLSACAYPKPLQKDLYVEIDWINDGVRDYKPTTGQINTIASTYEAQDIIPHFDVGQYGGGKQLSAPTGNLYFLPTEDQVDFFDLKNGTSTTDAEFSADRRNIWHYMITGKDYMKYIDDQTNSDVPGSTGNSLVGDDDSIISIQRIEDLTSEYNTNHPFNPPRSVDAAVAGTILHELGHNLCLSNPGDESYLRYPNQATQCVYSEIDKELNQNPLTTYISVMNYNFQLSGEDDYSHGANDPYDHDDWSAIALGINDFTEKTDPAELMFRRGGLDIKSQLAD
ncbi:MAG: hypothetical protein HZB75_01140 [Candidatus Saccharibacteria bacterium]|nr:MAG: hypothetical protein HZB75_01140 [Candidatus Saccharibacteria bacterium]